MNNLLLLLLHLLFVQGIMSLYQDQAGKFDWIKRYVGPVQHILFDETNSPSSQVIVSTSQNVIAALSTKTGEILWRHVLELDESGKIEAINVNANVVSVVTGNHLRLWNVATAALVGEVVLELNVNEEDSFTHFFSFRTNTEELFLISLSKGLATIKVFDAASGTVITENSVPASWLHSNSKCHMAKTVLVCLDVIGGNIHYLGTSSQQTFSSVPLLAMGIMEVAQQSAAGDHFCCSLTSVDGSDEHLIAKIGNARKLIHVHSDGIHLVKDITNYEVVSITKDTLFVVTQAKQIVTIDAISLPELSAKPELKTVTRFQRQTGIVKKIEVNLFARNALQIFVLCADHSIHFVEKAGVMWSREEALASISAVETVDLPVAGAAENYQEQLSHNFGILYSFLYRVKSHLMVIVNLKDILFSRTSEASSTNLERDRFNLHKLMLVASASGKIFALDNWSGEVVWSRFFPQLTNFKDSKLLLFTQRTSAHFPRIPQCTLLGKNSISGSTLLIVFNPLTGEGIGDNGGVIDLGYKIVQASLIQQMDDDFIKPLLIISEDLKPSIIPRSGEKLVLQMKSWMYLYLTDMGSSMFTGYSMKNSKPAALQLTPVWNLSFGKNVSIVGVYGKRSYERIHSPGRVLADRSVLYKYANPHLVVVATTTYDPVNKNSLAVHLVDTVTGNIIESVSHKRVSGPYHFVHSENWLIYSVFNEKYRRNEVTTLELFEGWEQSNSTDFSSFAARPTPPVVERQSFIMPQAVQAATHTTTEKGITTKFILFALKSGHVLQLSKWFLDPRRPVSNMGPMDEMLTPYMPEVPLISHEMINYNHSLPRVNSIFTAPAGLESTCIVLVYGLDLFYTRLFPSKMFDVLKDDFDHYLIVAVLVALIVASFVTKKLAEKKTLKQAWK